MQYIGYTRPIMLIASEGKQLVDANAEPETDEEGNAIEREPVTVVFLADGTTEAQAREMYREE